MTKADIITEVHNATGVEKTIIAEILAAATEAVKNSVANGEAVYLRGFGSFIAKKRAAKTARNIIKGTTLTIPARKVPAFKPSKSFIVKK